MDCAEILSRADDELRRQPRRVDMGAGDCEMAVPGSCIVVDRGLFRALVELARQNHSD